MDDFLGRLIEELQPYLNEDEIAYGRYEKSVAEQ